MGSLDRPLRNDQRDALESIPETARQDRQTGHDDRAAAEAYLGSRGRPAEAQSRLTSGSVSSQTSGKIWNRGGLSSRWRAPLFQTCQNARVGHRGKLEILMHSSLPSQAQCSSVRHRFWRTASYFLFGAAAWLALPLGAAEPVGNTQS